MAVCGKKKVAIVLDGAMVGGIETALIQMLRKIDTDKYEISLFTNILGNPCIGQIPECIKVIDLNSFDLRSSFFYALRNIKLCRAVKLFLSYIKIRLSKSDFQKVKISQEQFMLSEEFFDCAVAYKPSWTSVLWVLDHIKASKKAVWVHGPIWGSLENKWIERADRLFCVSEDARKNVESVCPDVVNRTEVLHNLLDGEDIILKAGDGFDFGEEITLVTVARLTSQKGQDMIPMTMRYLKDAGYQVKWFIVGDGDLRDKIVQMCKELDVQENVILTGTKSNPYPYIKGCDIYVQTSIFEGWGLTVQEAKILNKPIVTTDLPVMREQIEHMRNGYITDGISPEALFEGIKTLLDDPELCSLFTNELKKFSHDNSGELEKLYAFIEN